MDRRGGTRGNRLASQCCGNSRGAGHLMRIGNGRRGAAFKCLAETAGVWDVLEDGGNITIAASKCSIWALVGCVGAKSLVFIRCAAICE